MKPIIIALAGALALASCGHKGDVKEKETFAAVNLSPPLLKESLREDFNANAPEQKIELVTERKVIKEGTLRFATKDMDKTKSAIAQVVQELGGYISKDEANNNSSRTEQTLELRIPSGKFDLLLDKVSENAEKPEYKNVNVQDVTEEYIDVDSRLKTKKELEARYTELLKRAVKVEEILSIEQEMGKLREEIESVEGRLRFLKDRISLSSLTVTYYKEIPSVSGFTPHFGQALGEGWENLLQFCVGITRIWPFILLLIAALIFIKVSRKRRKPLPA